MADSNPLPITEIRFGRTIVTVAVGELVDQPVEAIIVPANQRAMFAAGSSGTLWSAAGEDVERELRAHAPLEIGTAVLTGSGRLAERGIRYIAHAIISAGLGEQPKALLIPDALEQALDRLVDVRARSVAIPILGVSARSSLAIRIDGAGVIVDTLVAHLRTRKHRIEHGILVSRFEDDRAPLEALVVRARERLWTS